MVFKNYKQILLIINIILNQYNLFQIPTKILRHLVKKY